MCVIDNNNKVKDRMRLKTERNQKASKLHLYIIDPNKNTTSFLRITNKYDSLIKEMQANKKLLPDRYMITDKGYDYVFIGEVTEEDEKKQAQIQKMQSNIRNYRYSLTLKGLLLYLQKTYNIGEIDAVLRNLSTSYPSEFPFLWFYQDFKTVLGRAYPIQLLKDISIELQNQLNVESNYFLIYWVMNRYFYGID